MLQLAAVDSLRATSGAGNADQKAPISVWLVGLEAAWYSGDALHRYPHWSLVSLGGLCGLAGPSVRSGCLPLFYPCPALHVFSSPLSLL